MPSVNSRTQVQFTETALGRSPPSPAEARIVDGNGVGSDNGIKTALADFDRGPDDDARRHRRPRGNRGPPPRDRDYAAAVSLPDDSDIGDIDVVRLDNDSAFYSIANVKFLEIGSRPDLGREVHYTLVGLALGADPIVIGVDCGDLALKWPGLRCRDFKVRRLRVNPATGRERQHKGDRERKYDASTHRFTSSQERICAARIGRRIAFPWKNSNTPDEARVIRCWASQIGP